MKKTNVTGQRIETATKALVTVIRFLPVIAVGVMMVGEAFGFQQTPRTSATQFGAILRWLLWIVIAPLLAVMGVFKLVGSWGMWGNGQQGWIQKGVAGLGYMMFPAILDVALQVARGETPDLGLSGVLGD